MNNEVTSASNVQMHTQSIAGLATQLGYDGDLTVGSLEDGIRLYQRRTIEDLFELGKRLLLLKEQCQHGEFQNRVELLGFDPSLARRLMTATLKFAKQETSPVLKTVKTQSKLLELIVLDDEEIKVISEGGSIGDISLDTIETMSVRDLKKALREAKAAVESKAQDLQAKDLIIQKKDQKLNDLDEKLTKLNSPAEIKKRTESEPQRLAEKALEDMNAACLTMHNDTVRFANNINSILEAVNEHDLYAIQDRLEANVVALFQQIAQTSVDLGIQIDFQSMVNPDWMQSASTSESEA